jgi:hypothetical protein
MVYAIGIESLIKLIAVVLVGALAFTCWRTRPRPCWAGVARLASRFDPSHLSLESWVIALLGCAVLVLPRQFYMGLVERAICALRPMRVGAGGLSGADGAAGAAHRAGGRDRAGSRISPDFYMLTLPLVSGHGLIAAAALIGGIDSAAAAMVITMPPPGHDGVERPHLPHAAARRGAAEAGAYPGLLGGGCCWCGASIVG